MGKENRKMKPSRSAASRILYACIYSKDGIIEAFRGETAFRQETALFTALLPVLYFLPLPLVYKMVLFSANCLVLIVELINSSIEAAVDLASPEHHELAKKAKDMGSAAVFLSLALAACLWIVSVYSLM